jgi:hypothetical protein
MPLFNRYLFADYSGGGENNRPQRNIRLYRCIGAGEPERLLHTVINPQTGNPLHFSRDALTQRVQSELELAAQVGHRVIFGFDHQYAWPPHMRDFAGIAALTWRDALPVLDAGNLENGLPQLDIPSRYCAAFNHFCGNNVFWCPLTRRAQAYGIPGTPLGLPPTDRFRLTELMTPLQGNSRPKPADAVGGQGEGIVGGQTICGLHQIAQMLDDELVTWWPFDGLGITGEAYRDKHVGVEIYPSALRPDDVAQDDDNDAYHSCLYVRDADHADELAGLMTLDPPAELLDRIQVEGWIIGMNPGGLPEYAGPAQAGVINQAPHPPTLQELVAQLAEHERRIRELERRLEELGNAAGN